MRSDTAGMHVGAHTAGVRAAPMLVLSAHTRGVHSLPLPAVQTSGCEKYGMHAGCCPLLPGCWLAHKVPHATTTARPLHRPLIESIHAQETQALRCVQHADIVESHTVHCDTSGITTTVR